ncbi:hypothetical protein [Bacillus velezensis]|uniref:hypothetical protein n=1 Tax=Bacillus velezensis TaxID=492670 RepID=UPI003EBFD586
MEKGLLFFTLAIAAAWIILDDFYGNKHLTNIAKTMTPDVNTPFDQIGEKVQKDAQDTADLFSGRLYKKYKETKKKDPKAGKKIDEAAKKSFTNGFFDGLFKGIFK